MNDIERIAAVIRANRLKDAMVALQKHSEENIPTNEVVQIEDVVNAQLEVSKNVRVEKSIMLKNDALLADIDSDFGLGSGVTQPDELVLDNVARRDQGADKQSSPRFRRKAPFIEIQVETLAGQGFITPITPRGLMTEQFRRIKRPLLKNLNRAIPDGSNNNVIMVTSSVSGEGKTYTSFNLSMSLALERERTVLLVDADVLKTSKSSFLDEGKSRLGLTDLLSGEVQDPADVILKTNIANFTYLPAGSLQENTNELLSSAGMKRLIDELSSRYHDRIIILDCPPLLQTNEACVISDYAKQVVFVVAEEDTSQSFVLEALTQIPEDRYVGVILNKSSKRFLGIDYGYTYDYG